MEIKCNSSRTLEFAEAYMVDYCLRRQTHQIDGNEVTVTKALPNFDEEDPVKAEGDKEGNEDQANKDEGEGENGVNEVENENSQKEKEEETSQGNEDPTEEKDGNNIE